MESFSVKLNLATLKCVLEKKKNKAGDLVDCLVIPLEANRLFKGEKGGIYLDLNAWPTDPAKRIAGSLDTHIVKQQFPKEEFAAMTDEQKKEIPIMGNATVWAGKPEATAPEIETDGDIPF